jgi:hypothetical protein
LTTDRIKEAVADMERRKVTLHSSTPDFC